MSLTSPNLVPVGWAAGEVCARVSELRTLQCGLGVATGSCSEGLVV